MDTKKILTNLQRQKSFDLMFQLLQFEDVW
jgi:hypothetical protein